MMHRYLFTSLFLLLLCYSGLAYAEQDGIEGQQIVDIHDLVIPNNFDYAMTQELEIFVETENHDGEPITGTLVEMFHSYDLLADPPATGQQIYKGMTQQDGTLAAFVIVHTYVERILVRIAYIGLPSVQEIILGDSQSFDIHFTPQ